MAPRSIDRARKELIRYLGVRSSYNPTFTPDGKRLVYVSDTTGVPQVWSLELESDAGPQQLTHYEDRVGSVSGARNSDALIFSKDHGGNESFQLLMMRGDGSGLTQLTDSPDVIHSFGGWSPDENSVLVSSNERNRAFFDVYMTNLSTGETSPLHISDHTDSGVDWSPDGKHIIFRRDYAPFNHDLFLVRIRGVETRCITQHKGDVIFSSVTFDDSSKRLYLITDKGREFAAPAILQIDSGEPEVLLEGKWDTEELALSEDGQRMAFATNEDGMSKLMLWELSGTPVRVRVPRGVIGSLEWSKKGDKLAFTFSGARHNPDIWIHDLTDGSTRKVTQSSASGLDLDSFPQPKRFRYKSFDGLTVSFYVYKARGGKARSPAVVYIHGGPESQFRPGFNAVVQFLASTGLTVITPNVRGSTGYGRTYTHLDDVRKRMDSVADIDRLVEHIKKEKMVDFQRIAVMGGSYGGFMVLACMYRYPDLWAAGVDIVGISNFVTFLRNTGPWRRKLRAAEYGDPARDRDFLERISPLNNATKIKAPLFIIHGRNDPRVPFGETRQIEVALKRLKREVHMMVFDDEGHGLVKLKNRISGYSAATEFLLGHLSGK